MTCAFDAQRLIQSIDKNASIYDPARPTIGKIYRDLQLNSDHLPITIGDMSHELLNSLVEDINEALCAPGESDEPFYLLISEKRDLQMTNQIFRLRKRLSYRPYPEDSTLVFWKDPRSQEVRFCWDLPHWAEMDLILANESQYAPSYINHIKAWKEVDLKPFGFYMHSDLKWIPNPVWKDRTLAS